MERTWAAHFDKVAACRQSHDRHGRSRSPSYPCCHGRGQGRTTFAERNGLQCVGGKVHTDIKYLEGGGMMVWETDASFDTTDFDYWAKKKQCRHRSPTPYQHHTSNHRRTPSPSPPHHLATVNYRRTPTPSPPGRCAISHCRTPMPGPSCLPFTSTLPTSATLVSSSAVELVVIPRRSSAPLGFIISPNV
jgi:hypothetical protein